MKKYFILAIALFMTFNCAFAQNDTVPKPKKGGFMRALKKGVESTTGLKVSDEALFVYPNIAEWKFVVVSCIGDKATGTVLLSIDATKLASENPERNVPSYYREVTITGGEALVYERRAANPLQDFFNNKPTRIQFESIYNVPVDVKSIDVKFVINKRDRVFEGRRIAIEWQ